jgi:hypothetical protein
MVPGPIFKRSDGRGNCKMGPGTILGAEDSFALLGTNVAISKEEKKG